jgi:anti-anti-sigma factor
VQALERPRGSVTIVDITGRIRLDDGAQEFRALIARLFAEGKRAVVLNMAACPYVDSAGLGELATALVKARNAGGQLVLLNVAERIQELLRITRLLRVFIIRHDEPSAVDAALTS